MAQQEIFSPFKDFGVLTYDQYKRRPFLVLGSMKTITENINATILEVKNKQHFGTQMILVGQKGIGKTSSLFFIKDLLENNNQEVHLLTRLYEDNEDLKELTGKTLAEIKKPTFILIDFPDRIDTPVYKKFLTATFQFMQQKHDYLHLIFAMNQSHYHKSFSHSELFGKFLSLRLDPFNEDETEQLINSRFKSAKLKTEDFFTEENIELIYRFSKGIPRNVISACSLVFKAGKKISKTKTEELLQNKYTERVIADRITDIEQRQLCNMAVMILKKEFNGRATIKKEYEEKIVEQLEIGLYSAKKTINELLRIGVFAQYRGGHQRNSKIITLKSDEPKWLR